MDEKVFLRKQGGRLVPAWAHDADLLARVPEGTVVSTALRRPRRPRHHRWWWALMTKVADSHPFYASSEQVCDHIKFRLGMVDTTVVVVGEDVHTMMRPQSIAFESMGQDTFKAFCEKGLDIICAEILPGVEREDLRREIDAMIGPDEPKEKRHVG
jgi:hypothetical protein